MSIKDWKVHQILYHARITEHTDDSSNFETIIDNENIVDRALWYFDNPDPDISYYPSKSFVVGIVYAKLININYGDDFYETLSDPELLFNNDKYFTPYPDAKEIYDTIINRLGGIDNIPLSGPLIDYTKSYFYAECMGVDYVE